MIGRRLERGSLFAALSVLVISLSFSVSLFAHIYVRGSVAVLMDSFLRSVSSSLASLRSISSCFVLRVYQALLYLWKSFFLSSSRDDLSSTTAAHAQATGNTCSSNDDNDGLTFSSGFRLWATTGFLIMAVGCGALFRASFRRRDSQASDMKGINHPETASMSSSTSTDGGRPSVSVDKRVSSVRGSGSTAFRIKSLIAMNRGELAFAFTYASFKNSFIDSKIDAIETDPGFLRKNSSNISYTTSLYTYPGIRTFFCPHPHASKLPSKPNTIPLLVFVHGLGGSLAQFHPLLTSLTNTAPCFGIDLPGCGLSSFSPTSWDAYSVEALVTLLAVAIEQHRDREEGQKVVLIGHSLGCSFSALLASSKSPLATELRKHIVGFVAICPKASPPSAQQVPTFRKLLHVPGPIFDLWRAWDRRGGINSSSVSRFVGKDADRETKELQVRFNKQSKTPVWRRMAWGTLPRYDQRGQPIGGMPGKEIWEGIHLPILLIAGESDEVTKAEEVTKLLEYFANGSSSKGPDEEKIGHAVSNSDDVSYLEKAGGQVEISRIASGSSNPRKRVVKSSIIPAPASHALLYDRTTCRILAGLIQDFLPRHIDHRLSRGWQLQHLTTSGKWDVKNLAKWKSVPPVSKPIAGTFAALKTLREIDEQHTPARFVEEWKNKIYAVIDISHETPVYDTTKMDKGGIQYLKFPTVSKIPPNADEVRGFIALVDRLQSESRPEGLPNDQNKPQYPVIGVHCHYGFNRTGFLIASYLIERKGFGVQDAIDEFEKCRPPGIRHQHFIDTLFVRYCVGLQRAPTL